MRSNRVVTISLPPQVVARLLKTAKAKGMTHSELIREALRHYELEDQEWQMLFTYGQRQARAAFIRTEEDVERHIDDVRRCGSFR